MTAEIFLKRLYAKLKWRTTQEETQDIIQDYREFFEEEQKQGKTEDQICETLGSPQQVIQSIMSERKLLPRHFLYWPCCVLVIVSVPFYPIMTILGNAYGYGLLWPYTEYVHYVYVLAAPIPAILFYQLQHKHGYATGISKLHFRLFGAMFIFSFLLTVISSTAIYRFLKDFQERSSSYNIENVYLVHYILMATIWLIAGAWLICVLLSNKCGRFSPGVYFIYAAMLAIVMHYIDILSAINFEEIGIPDMLVITFQPIAPLLILAAIGAGSWSVYQLYSGCKRGNQ